MPPIWWWHHQNAASDCLSVVKYGALRMLKQWTELSEGVQRASQAYARGIVHSVLIIRFCSPIQALSIVRLVGEAHTTISAISCLRLLKLNRWLIRRVVQTELIWRASPIWTSSVTHPGYGEFRLILTECIYRLTLRALPLSASILFVDSFLT